MKSLWRRGTSLFSTPTASPGPESPDDFRTAPSPDKLFPKTDPAVDGEECLHDCSTCTVRYPAKFDVDTQDTLYGNVNGWATHLLVATGKTDWVRDVADEPGSVMEAIERGGVQACNGNLKLTASNIPVPDEYHYHEQGKQPTTVLILPSFTIVDHVTPALAPDLIRHFVDPSPTTTTPLRASHRDSTQVESQTANGSEPANGSTDGDGNKDGNGDENANTLSLTPLRSRPCPHAAVILLCSQRTRDARCGQSAPLLRKEFERHLRPLGLHRDLDDERPGGVGVYFISHVGGHKYAANVIVYRRRDFDWFRKDGGNGDGEEKGDGEGAAQGIWLARVRPEDCENIVKFTVLKGKVVKPEQIRGGFDRERGVMSW
ncbi:Sucrase/ferredoxin-like-domain-containing protein [Aspergillus avenaceus]|uniref:Sucrase/ferredoxin-like-domain-containing protein n=1 Tax=Aspergillus avenaceus TaxID=36643 RepID=A0A5N6TKS0_ASPAV|nr:Sucrase/ferredoxin-like-domain-containing protein [Aspergillus avenaceus]